MRNDPDNPTLFGDDDQDLTSAWEHAREHARDCARRILKTRPTARISQNDIDDLMMDLLRWCSEERELNGKHYSPEEQMQWLVDYIRDNSTESPSTGQLHDILLKKFQPPSPPGNSFEAFDRAREKWIAELDCLRCRDGGTLIDENGREIYCTCAAGEGAKQNQILAKSMARSVARPLARPPSLRFARDGRVLPPKRATRQRN